MAVLDRGPGIPETHIDKIFDRFHQVEEAKHHSVPGMGLGLYIAREIAKLHCGSAECEPREGGGAVFRIKIGNNPLSEQ